MFMRTNRTIIFPDGGTVLKGLIHSAEEKDTQIQGTVTGYNAKHSYRLASKMECLFYPEDEQCTKKIL
jgi:hypothetical protein